MTATDQVGTDAGPGVATDAAAARAVLRHDLGLAADDPLADALGDDYVRRYAALSAAAHRRGALGEAERELVQMAVCAAVQLHDGTAVHLHARRAIAAGATVEQVLATRVETLGTHTMSFGAPLVLEALEAAGRESEVGSDPAEDRRVEERLRELRGHWNEAWRPMMRLDPEFLVATHELLAPPPGVLDPKLRELIYIALDVSTAHLYPNGARSHLRNALALGATVDEIMEVLELTALVGYRSLVPLLGAVSGGTA
ncbi:hypothetical protein GCM10009836_01990 [Pseudonocardia ailaonensis]|uniref:Carboxymuconolactone decarboxylase-like domain-containing protein n=1 Tax=Pseudonocardia ailaonensis TaxID=367279 RepID=A0ABN2ML20_9PSEU